MNSTTNTVVNFGIVLLMVLFIMVNLSCEEDVPTEIIPILGKRDYTWTVDTLAYPGSFQTLMRDIWASSPKDVYVVGHNDQPGPGTMFHYDGTRWTTTHFHVADGGTVNGAVSLSAVYGFSPNDVWAVGQRIYQNPNPPPNFFDSSFIMKFDGSLWREVKTERARFLADISGTATNNIWIVGREKGSIFHINEATWIRDTIFVQIPDGGSFQIYSVAVVSQTELYAFGNTHINNLAKDIYYFFYRNEDGWKTLDTAIIQPSYYEIKWGYSKLWMSPWGKMYSVGDGVFVRENGGWVKILDTDRVMSGIYGSHENNIFFVGQFGRVYHWNGNDWFQFTAFPPSIISLSTEWMFDIWTDGNEVFIVGQADGQRTLILHGK
ncbi:MAG: hypothetical protein HYZ34_03430 [Ignavibacteriae bacterium]|nr:hypothetical protein [Ignavibacteriota bacterium]